MISRRSLATLGGLAAAAAGSTAGAQPRDDRGPVCDGSHLFTQLEGARLPRELVSVRTAGDSVVGVGAATFTTRLTNSPHARAFRAADGRVFEMQPELEGWSLAAFGMLPNTVDQTRQSALNRQAHQQAIDHAIWLELNGHGTQRLVFSPGAYFVDRALQIFRHDPASGMFEYVSLEIAAPARGYVPGRRTQIRNTNNDQPCYAVQSARNVRFEGFSIVGANPHYLPAFEELLGDPAQWCNRAGMRQARWSPACAIVVDPFGSTRPPDGGYPGLCQYYTSNERGSSTTTIQNMECQGFPCGVLLSPSLDTQNNDSVMIRDCDLGYNTIAVATCQSQNRAVRVENCRIGPCHVMFDTASLGEGHGAFPIGRDLNVSYCKHLVLSASGVSRGKLVNCDVEATYAIGEWQSGGFPLDIEGCQIKLIAPVRLYPPHSPGQPAIDWHLSAGAPVNFIGGYVGFYSNEPVPLSIIGGGKVTFTGTALDAPVIAENPGSVHYDGVSLRYLNAGNRYGVERVFAAPTERDLAFRMCAMMPPGGIAVLGSGETATIYRTLTGVASLLLDVARVTVRRDGVASFRTSTPGKYRVGEWLCAGDVCPVGGPDGETRLARNVLLGQVASIEGNAIVLRCAPQGMTTGEHHITVQGLRPFRRRCIALARAGDTVLRAAAPIEHGFEPGDRLLATPAVPDGAVVTAVDLEARTITISLAALATGSTQVKTAELILEQAAAAAQPHDRVAFAGDFVRNLARTRGEDGRLVLGWLAISDGASGVFAPQYL